MGMIEFKGNGQTFQGYLATPDAPGPGVIVIQEWWGLVGHIKAVADRFAEAGFVALAPDFYHGKTTDEPDDAGTMMMALNIDEAAKVIRGAVSALLVQPQTHGSQVGTVGFCMGGQLSLYAATVDERVGACVNYYGVHPDVKPDFTKLSGPVRGFFGSEDHITPPAAVESLRQQLEKAGADFDLKTYEGRPHAFFNDDRPEVYDAEAAADSWREMLAFFRKELAE